MRVSGVRQIFVVVWRLCFIMVMFLLFGSFCVCSFILKVNFKILKIFEDNPESLFFSENDVSWGFFFVGKIANAKGQQIPILFK